MALAASCAVEREEKIAKEMGYRLEDRVILLFKDVPLLF